MSPNEQDQERLVREAFAAFDQHVRTGASAHDLQTVHAIRRRRGRQHIIAITAAIAIVVAVPAAGYAARDLIGQATPGGVAASTAPTGPTGPTLGGSEIPTPTPPASTQSASPTAARASAADQLADFFDRAQRMDAQLRHAAELINAGIGTDTVTMDLPTINAVKAIEPQTLLQAIPGGLSPSLLRSVLLVYSDLVSRRYAMASVGALVRATTLPRGGDEAKFLIGCLGNGAPAAARFGRDLAQARAAAADSRPIVPVAANARATAEVAVYDAYIEEINRGCDTCGGGVLTTLPPLVWQTSTVESFGTADGTVDGIPFKADYRAGQGWYVELNAC